MLTVSGFIAQQPYKVEVDEKGRVWTPDGLAGDDAVAVLLVESVGSSWPPTPTSSPVPFDELDPLSVAAALTCQTTVTGIDGVVLTGPADPSVVY